VQLPVLAFVLCQSTAIASGHRANAQAVARDFGIPHVFGDERSWLARPTWIS